MGTADGTTNGADAFRVTDAKTDKSRRSSSAGPRQVSQHCENPFSDHPVRRLDGMTIVEEILRIIEGDLLADRYKWHTFLLGDLVENLAVDVLMRGTT